MSERVQFQPSLIPVLMSIFLTTTLPCSAQQKCADLFVNIGAIAPQPSKISKDLSASRHGTNRNLNHQNSDDHLTKVVDFQKRSKQKSEGSTVDALEIAFGKIGPNIRKSQQARWQQIILASSQLIQFEDSQFQTTWREFVKIRETNSRSFNEAYQEAESLMYNHVLEGKDLDENFVKELNRILRSGPRSHELNGASSLQRKMDVLGSYRIWNISLSTGMMLRPEDVDIAMKRFIVWYDHNKKILNPIELALEFSARFISIHPFSNANGRTARLLVDFILLKGNILPPLYISHRDVPEDAILSWDGKVLDNDWDKIFEEYTVGLENSVNFFRMRSRNSK